MVNLKDCLVAFCLIMWSTVAAAGQLDIGKQLDEYSSTYNKIDMQEKGSAIETLVNLDLKLRAFTKEIRNQRGEPYWKRDYEKLGLGINHYTDAFDYYGTLLSKAHKIDPNSKFRKYTLFTEINSDGYCWVEKPQHLEAAFQYLKEFPNGPFASKVYEALGSFYGSFYECIKYHKEELEKDSQLKPSEFDSCADVFQQYIKKPSMVSADMQEKQAKDNTIKYYEAYLKTDKNPSKRIEKALIELKEGTEVKMRHGIYSCPD